MTNLVLEACNKEYKKLYLEHENLKKKKKKCREQQEELLKYRNHYIGSRTTNKAPQDRKMKLSNIKFDEEN